MVTLWICSIFSVKAQTTIYEHGAEITSIDQISNGTPFVMKKGDKYMCFPNVVENLQNASLKYWSPASSSNAFYFKLETPASIGQSTGQEVPEEINDKYIIRVQTPSKGDYNPWGTENCYLNSASWIIFSMGLTNQEKGFKWGTDIEYGAIWDLYYSAENKGWTIKNIGWGKYMNNAGGPGDNAEYWKLYKAEVDINDITIKDVQNDVAEAQSILNSKMGTAAKDALQKELSSVVNPTENNAKEIYQTFHPFLKKAKESILFYSNVAPYIGVEEKIDGTGIADLCTTDYFEISQQYADGTLDESSAGSILASIKELVYNSVKAQSTPGSSMTLAIINPSFETGTLEGWTSENGGEAQDNQAFSGRTDAIYFQVFAWESQLSNGSLKQTIKGLPNGKYTLTAEMQNVKNYDPKNDRCTGYYLEANGVREEVKAPGKTVSVTTDVTNGDLTIGTVIENCTGNWVCADNFQLTYLGETEADNPNSETFPGTTVSATYKWGTFISQVDRELPNGLEAYICTGITDDDKLKLVEVTSIKANTAYILKNTTDVDIVIPAVEGVSKAKQNPYTTGLLTGSYVHTNVPANSYILQSKKYQTGFQTGFYLCNTTGLSVGENRCYLTLPGGPQNVRSFIFNEDGATGVPTLKPETLDKLSNGKIYDVNGRELKSQQKGINIINGRKVNVR